MLFCIAQVISTSSDMITDFNVQFFLGYQYTFPFLSVDCGISVDENFVSPLFKHCININFPTMALIGLPTFVCASQMFDLQVSILKEFFLLMEIESI